jgi:hypothetical protein
VQVLPLEWALQLELLQVPLGQDAPAVEQVTLLMMTWARPVAQGRAPQLVRLRLKALKQEIPAPLQQLEVLERNITA